MKPKTPEQKSRWLAEFKFGKGARKSYVGFDKSMRWITGENTDDTEIKVHCKADDFDPLESLDDMMECVDKYLSENPDKDFSIDNNRPDKGWIVMLRENIVDSSFETIQTVDESLHEAIYSALVAAVGGES